MSGIQVEDTKDLLNFKTMMHRSPVNQFLSRNVGKSRICKILFQRFTYFRLDV